jgi:hypothetical protein
LNNYLRIVERRILECSIRNDSGNHYLFFLAIVWVYNLIWFVPLDFIKFGLQATFDRSIRAVQPFDRFQRRRVSIKVAENAVGPEETFSTTLATRRQVERQYSRQVTRQSIEEEEIDKGQPSQLPESLITTLNHLTQTGASFYAPYTDTLSALRRQNPLLRSVSVG